MVSEICNITVALLHLPILLFHQRDLAVLTFCFVCQQDRAPRDYIIEIKIYPQKTAFKFYEDGSFKAQIPTIYQNEEGICFFRKSASCVEVSITFNYK